MGYSKFSCQKEVLVATLLNVKDKRINIKVIYSKYETYVCKHMIKHIRKIVGSKFK